jgi:hypothetical protein
VTTPAASPSKCEGPLVKHGHYRPAKSGMALSHPPETSARPSGCVAMIEPAALLSFLVRLVKQKESDPALG